MKGAGEQMKQTAGEVPAIPSDTAITDKINSTLPDTLKTDDVHVTTKDGVVTLTGSVGSQAERNRVLKLAGQTPGVERIRDQLEVAHGGK
jgi:hyperosmotically inducible protein